MNELELVRQFCDDAPLRTLSELDGARSQLADAIAASSAQAAAAGRPRRTWGMGGARGSLAAAGALLVTAVVVILAGGGGGARVGVRFGGRLGATEVLSRAAFVALRVAPERPQPDQFVYTRVVQTGGVIRQSWLSVDGARDSSIDGRTDFGCRDGVMRFPFGPTRSRPCTPTPAYFPDMPFSSAPLLAYLGRTQGVDPGDLNDLAKTVGYMLDSYYLLPAQQAALFRLLSGTAGIAVRRGVTDAAGRRGVGVVWTFEGSRAMLIFDPVSYRYLGTTTYGEQGQRDGAALLRTAIVSSAGEVPRRVM